MNENRRRGLGPMRSLSGKMNTRNHTAKELFSIRGLIVPVDWDAMGRVTAVAISTFDEEEYLVSGKGKGNELLTFLRKVVEVEGIPSLVEDERMITVKRYRLLAKI
jgi:hypothetical protein